MENASTLSLTIGPTGIAPTAAITLSPGIRILTGRNNVGKSRILQTWSAIAKMGDLSAMGSCTIEVKKHGRRYHVEWLSHNESSKATYSLYDQTGTVLGHWVLRKNQNQWVILDNNGNQSASTNLPNLSLFAHTPEFSSVTEALQRIVYVPAHRTVESKVTAKGLTTPSPTGNDLGQVLHHYQSRADPKIQTFDMVVEQIFPEIEQVLTISDVQEPAVTIAVREKFVHELISLRDCGAGVAQILHLVALVIFSSPGRIFLIDEPHVFLHPESERTLAQFLRDHSEHDYIVATHSVVMINALHPVQIWLATRDQGSTQVQAVFLETEGRQQIFESLGWEFGDFAWVERILFVEGPSDYKVWPIFFERWEWADEAQRCTVIPLNGSGATSPVQAIMAEIRNQFSIDMLFCLDGDQEDKESGADVVFLPVHEIENVLMRDSHAIRQVFLEENPFIDDKREELLPLWSADKIEHYLQSHPDPKGSKRLGDLAHEMGLRYNKVIHNAQIAKQMNIELVHDLQELVQSFVLKH